MPSETVQNGVQGLMYLLTESSKLLMNDLDFHDSIIILGYPADLNELLLKVRRLLECVQICVFWNDPANFQRVVPADLFLYFISLLVHVLMPNHFL